MVDLKGKRILFAITKSNWGGAQSYVFALATRCAREGANVAVALGGTGLPGSDTGLLAARLREEGIRTRIVPALGREISPLHELKALKDLRDFLKEERPDVLHLNSPKAGALGALAGRLARVPRIIYTVHGWPHREPRPLLWKGVVRGASWITVLLCHAVIVVSELDYETSPALFLKRRIHVIHNGVPQIAYFSRDEARRFLAPAIPELARLPKWLLMTAELTRNKGIDIAIRAFAGVSTNIDDAALVIVGEGEDHAALLDLIDAYHLKQRVFLLGFVPEARTYLSAGTVFLLPSRKEGLPLVLLEAGLAALPVIASRTGGVPEIVEHGRSGLLVRPEDVDGLADAITRLLLDPDEARFLGTELREKVAKHFSEEEMLRKTAGLYVA